MLCKDLLSTSCKPNPCLGTWRHPQKLLGRFPHLWENQMKGLRRRYRKELADKQWAGRSLDVGSGPGRVSKPLSTWEEYPAPTPAVPADNTNNSSSAPS